jgi:hypothetical protein
MCHSSHTLQRPLLLPRGLPLLCFDFSQLFEYICGFQIYSQLFALVSVLILVDFLDWLTRVEQSLISMPTVLRSYQVASKLHP